jgi:hypothetical protein
MVICDIRPAKHLKGKALFSKLLYESVREAVLRSHHTPLPYAIIKRALTKAKVIRPGIDRWELKVPTYADDIHLFLPEDVGGSSNFTNFRSRWTPFGHPIRYCL